MRGMDYSEYVNAVSPAITFDTHCDTKEYHIALAYVHILPIYCKKIERYRYVVVETSLTCGIQWSNTAALYELQLSGRDCDCHLVCLHLLLH